MFICCCLCNFFSLSFHQKVRLGTGGGDDDNGNTRSIPSPSSQFGSPQSHLPALPFPPVSQQTDTWCAVPGHGLLQALPWGTPAQPPPLVTARHKTPNLNSTSKPQSPQSISPELWQSLHSPMARQTLPWTHPGPPTLCQRLCHHKGLGRAHTTRNTYFIYMGKGEMEEVAQNPPPSRRGCAGGKYCS